jgi:hypothetical protein
LRVTKPIQGPMQDGTQPFDFNCDTKEETEVLPLTDCKTLSKAGCKGSGLLAPAGCAQSGKLGHCEFDLIGGLACNTIDDQTTQIQGCR